MISATSAELIEPAILLASLAVAFLASDNINYHAVSIAPLLILLRFLHKRTRSQAQLPLISFTSSKCFRPCAYVGWPSTLLLVPLALVSKSLHLRYSFTPQDPRDEIFRDYLLLCISLAVAFGSSIYLDFTLLRRLKSHSLTFLVTAAMASLTANWMYSGNLSWNLKIFACITFLHLLLRTILLMAPRNFTLGESCIITQIVGIWTLDAVARTFSEVGYISLVAVKEADAAVQTTMVYYLCQALILGMLVIGGLLYPLMRAVRHSSYSFMRKGLSIIVYLLMSIIVWFGLRPWVTFMVRRHHHLTINPFLWVLELTFFRPRHIYVALWWLLCLTGMTIILKFICRDNSNSSSSLDNRRKFFHFTAVILFIPSIVWTPHFMALAFAMAMSLFILFEFVRLFHLWIPYTDPVALNQFLSSFIDRTTDSEIQKDTASRSWDMGPLILSHIYLLVGCALPLWIIFPSSILEESHTHLSASLAATSGVVSVGLGDAMASLIGHRYGKTKWITKSSETYSSMSKKSVEGSIGYVVGCLLGNLLVILVCGPSCLDRSVGVAVMVSLMGAVLEAFSCQNDNLILPIWSVSISMILS